MYAHIDLFSGIGGMALGLSRAGIKTVQFVEIDPFCHKVLNKNFPEVPIHDDIKTFKYSGASPFILTAGCPCQPASCAGKRKGKDDDRWLWDEAFRVLAESRPTWAIFENVAGLLSLESGVVFDNLLTQMENQGYEVWPVIIPAASVGAPHRRDRVWICAHSLMCEHGTGRGQTGETDGLQGINRAALCSRGIVGADCHAPDTADTGAEGLRREREDTVFQDSAIAGTESEQTHTTEQRGLYTEFSGADSDAADTGNQRLQGGEWAGSYEQGQAAHGSIAERNHAWDEPWIEAATRLCGVDDGLPRQVDRVNRLKALGNAVVPQIVEVIGRAIMEIEKC